MEDTRAEGEGTTVPSMSHRGDRLRNVRLDPLKPGDVSPMEGGVGKPSKGVSMSSRSGKTAPPVESQDSTMGPAMGPPRTPVEEKQEDSTPLTEGGLGAAEPSKELEVSLSPEMALEPSSSKCRVIDIKRKNFTLKPLKLPQPSAFVVQSMKDMWHVGTRNVPLHPVGRKMMEPGLHVGIAQFSNEIRLMKTEDIIRVHKDFTKKHVNMYNLLSTLVDASVEIQSMDNEMVQYRAVQTSDGTIKFTVVTESDYVGLHAPIIDFFNILQTLFTGFPMVSNNFEGYPRDQVVRIHNAIAITAKAVLKTARAWEEFTDLDNAPFVLRVVRATLCNITCSELYNSAKQGLWSETIIILHNGFRTAMCDVHIVNAIRVGKEKMKNRALQVEIKAKNEALIAQAMANMNIDDSGDDEEGEGEDNDVEDAMSFHEEDDGTIRVHFAGNNAQENACGYERFTCG